MTLESFALANDLEIRLRFNQTCPGGRTGLWTAKIACSFVGGEGETMEEALEEMEKDLVRKDLTVYALDMTPRTITTKGLSAGGR